MSAAIEKLADRLEIALRWAGGFGIGCRSRTRAQLCFMLDDCGDRALRRAKECLVNRGVPVAAASSGGYYLATTAEEKWGAYRQFTTRIVALARQAKVFAQAAADQESMQLILDLIDAETDEEETT